MASETDPTSRLLSLPPELRVQIWDLLLGPAPKKSSKPGISEAERSNSVTSVSRTCSSKGSYVFTSHQNRAHEPGDESCDCNHRAFYIHNKWTSNDYKRLYPKILRVNRQIYDEALPSLYERRTFTADPNRALITLWDRCAEVWYLFSRWLDGLPEEARSHIRSIRLPMLLSKFEVTYAHCYFYQIARQLPNLQTVELEFSPSVVREHWLNDDDAQTGMQGIFDLSAVDEEYFLGPVMAFADAKIVVEAVDKHDIGKTIFDRVKPHIEMRVWKQLLPVRVKREQRRIGRIKSALGALEYNEIAAGSEHVEDGVLHV